MAIMLKCKICGGDISVNSDMTVGTCQYCGTTMTLPRIDTDKKVRLFNRANEYRINNEFDKAYDAYKTITEEDEQEAEAYWGMILSEYGIEYVEDPSGHKRIPTCHRTQIQNIQDSSNYKLALKYADGERRMMYRDEAEELDKLQRNILAISSKETSYDVFICYKEKDDEGNRTKDSVLAQDIYRELEKEGIKTFFSRITLETHIGENYEPYIYGALSSAKVMLVVATNGEYLDSVWVKNEWRRYLSFMKGDETKTIIPVYKGMTAYEFPSELSKFQAQDMEKIGAVQDLISGIKKLLGISSSADNKALQELIADKRKRDRANKVILKTTMIVLIGLLILGIISYGFVRVILPSIKYSKAEQAVAEGNYIHAALIFGELDGYKDSKDKRQAALLCYVEGLLDSGDVTKAEEVIEANQELLEVGLLKIAEFYIINQNYNKAIEAIAAYGSTSSNDDTLAMKSFLEAVIQMSKKNPNILYTDVLDNYENYQEHLKALSGVYYCQQQNKYLALREDGTAYLTTTIVETSLERLMDTSRFYSPDTLFYYDYKTKQYYVQYKGALRLEILTEENNAFEIQVNYENKSALVLLYRSSIYYSCDGTYTKVNL